MRLGFRSVIVIPRNAEPGEEGHAAPPGRASGRSPGAALQATRTTTCITPRRLAEALAGSEPNGAIWANQWDNVANRRAHIETTTEEIWDDLGGRVDGFVSAVGSGGTLGGVSDGLKAKRKDIQIALADVPGAALYSFYKTGVLKAEGSSITEGIGQGRITKNIEGAVVDHAYLIPDAEFGRRLLRPAAARRLCLGGSSGVNVAGAIRLAKEMGPGHTIVTMLCDYGTRYQSKLFNPGLPARRRTCRCRRGSPPGGPTCRPQFRRP